MRHRRRAYFALFDALFEILHRDIHPHVAVEVEHDGVDAAEGIEEGREIIVVGNLGRPLLAEVFVKELVGEGAPVYIGESRAVGVEIARGAAELAAHRHLPESLHLLAKAVGEHFDFLPESRRACRLPVCLRKHRDGGPFAGHALKCLNQLVDARGKHLVDSLFKAHRHGRVVDVLRRKPEVDKLLVLLEAEAVELFFEEIFDSLDVMVGHAFDVLDSLGLRGGENIAAIER